MPTFAPNATPRYKVIYKSAGFEHTMMFRAARGVSTPANIASGRSAAAGLADALEPLLPEDFQWIAEFYCPEDEEIFLPTGSLPAAISGAQAIADYSAYARATATTFSGKGGVSRARVEVFGVFWDVMDPAGVAANGDVTALEDSNVAAAVTLLGTVTGIRSISNTAVVWYPHATVKVNDHWLKEVRKIYP